MEPKPESVGRPDDPLPRLRVVVMGARPAGLPDVGDLGRIDQDRGQRPAGKTTAAARAVADGRSRRSAGPPSRHLGAGTLSGEADAVVGRRVLELTQPTHRRLVEPGQLHDVLDREPLREEPLDRGRGRDLRVRDRLLGLRPAPPRRPRRRPTASSMRCSRASWSGSSRSRRSRAAFSRLSRARSRPACACAAVPIGDHLFLDRHVADIHRDPSQARSNPDRRRSDTLRSTTSTSRPALMLQLTTAERLTTLAPHALSELGARRGVRNGVRAVAF